MDERLLKKLADRSSVVPIPGDSTFVMSPTKREAIEVAVIHHHRFAFFYWLKWATKDWTRSLSLDQTPPDLVTIDYHDDVGGECDCVFDELELLIGKLEVGDVDDKHELKDAARRRDQAKRNVATYSMLGLRALNDGHIFPAQYLNAVGDVFVLYKQREPNERSFEDQYGNLHHIRYFNQPSEVVKALSKIPDRCTYFDLDVDYFFEDKSQVRGNEKMVSEKQIRQLMDVESEFMTAILQRELKGVTFALEPTYCGGLPSCFRAMSIVMDALFSGNLLGATDVKWK